MQIKRLVGLPGERLRFEDGLLFVDGRHHPEPYLGGLPATPGAYPQDWRVPADHLFVMGDNRVRSTDSRRLGPIPEFAIVGLVARRFWPLIRRPNSGQD